MWIFFIYGFEFFLQILKNERNFTNFGYFFAKRFQITLTNFLGDGTNSDMTIVLILF